MGLTHWPPHLICPSGHTGVQTPAMQASSAPHMSPASLPSQLPDAPQWAGSVFGSTHWPSQATSGALQVTSQAPSAHISPGTQATPQSPQFFSSVRGSTHSSPHTLKGGGQTGPPEELDALDELELLDELDELDELELLEELDAPEEELEELDSSSSSSRSSVVALPPQPAPHAAAIAEAARTAATRSAREREARDVFNREPGRAMWRFMDSERLTTRSARGHQQRRPFLFCAPRRYIAPHRMLKPGYSFDRYTIEGVLGEGGMGLVYRAHDARLDRKVALKIVREPAEDPKQRDEAKARLLREARAAAALDHPNAVSIYDIGEVDGMPYIAMELVVGKTVRDVLEDASVTTTQRLRVLRDVARALAAAHKAGLVHRDIKPENVMVRGDGRVKVLDFGIARRSAVEDSSAAPAQSPALATLTAKDVRIGTPTYMAPERIRGEAADGRTDQFSWGVLAYELLTGSLPWKGHDAMSLVASILTEAPPPMKDGITKIPDGIEAVIRRTLAKAPADRYGSMDEVVSAVEALIAGSSASSSLDRPSSASVKPGAAASPRLSRGAGSHRARHGADGSLHGARRAEDDGSPPVLDAGARRHHAAGARAPGGATEVHARRSGAGGARGGHR
jgi:serine/threonine protein kinase